MKRSIARAAVVGMAMAALAGGLGILGGCEEKAAPAPKTNTPAEHKPAEKPADKPADKPAETPAEKK